MNNATRRENSTGETCKAYYNKYYDLSQHPVVIATAAVAYSVVFLLSLLGNSGVIYATVRYRSLQTVQNIFIVNLAVSGVILALISMPLTPVTHIAKEWFFGGPLCRVLTGVQAVGVFIGTFSLCAIAVDRYFRLVVAPGSPLRRESAIRITFFLWFLSLLITLPYVYHMEMKTYPKRLKICGIFCSENWPNNTSKRVYTIFVLVVQFLIPFSVMAFCYYSVFSFLSRRAKSRLTSIAQQSNLLLVVAATAGRETQQHKEQLTRLFDAKRRVIAQRRRVTMILVSMVLIFLVTSLPMNIVSTLIEFTDNTRMLTFWGEDYTYFTNLVTHFLAMLSCVSNPLLYAFLNPEFRELVLSGLAGIRWAAHFSLPATQSTMLHMERCSYVPPRIPRRNSGEDEEHSL